jgi:raffinose/stachyose/melibiose transport system permease protein
VVTRQTHDSTAGPGNDSTAGPGHDSTARHARENRARRRAADPYALYLPAAVVYLVIFLIPTGMAFYFALTRWTLFDSTFVGLDNFRDFLAEQNLRIGFQNTLVYAVVTSGLKVVLGLLLGVLLTSRLRLRGFLRSVVFFPVLVSTVAVGITFSMLLAPDTGLVDKALALVGVSGPDWLGSASTALLSVALVDVWKGVGLATVIYIAGILSIPQDYYQAVAVDGGTAWHRFRHVTLPLSWPATYSVIILSFIGGLRSFDLIWTMTRGGPGFTSDTIASIIYKQYQAGFFGLSTAGNVLLFLMVSAIMVPLTYLLGKRQVTT